MSPSEDALTADEDSSSDDAEEVSASAGSGVSKRPWYRRFTLADLFVAALLAWWGTKLTWGYGGHDAYVLSIAAAICILALLTVRPWEQLPTLALALAVGTTVAVWIVVLTAPTGLNGANDAATYAVAAVTLVVIASWAETEKRVWFVVGAVLVATLLEFGQAFWPWLGSMTPSHPMVGTFFYLNTFGAFMLPGAILGTTVALCDIKPLRILGLLVGPLSVVGVLYSTSKGSQIGLVIGMVAVTVLGAVAFRWAGLLRAAVVWVLSVALCFLVTGPPFFTGALGSVLPGSSTAQRAGSVDSTLEGAGARVEWWINSLSVFLHWPLSGSGFHSVADASKVVDAPIRSAFVHNGFLQALAEGGLVLAIPFLGGCIGIAFLSVRWIWRTLSTRHDLLQAGIAVAVLMLMGHSAMDFDWSFPASMMEFAILAALVIPRRAATAVPMRTPIGWLLSGLMVASLIASAVGAWNGNFEWSFPVN